MPRKRKFPRETVRVQFDARIAIVEIASGLASQGIVLRHNSETGDLYAVKDATVKPPSNVVPLVAKAKE